MPDAPRQSKPWERAGSTPAAWLRLLDRLTADWIAAAEAVRMLYAAPERPDAASTDAAELIRKINVADDLQADWRSAIDGEAPTIRSLLQRYRIEP
jgi:hypothetical protein